MNSIVVILGLIIFAILFGKRTKQVHLYSFLVVLFLALFELVAILIQVYTMSRPSIQ